uniref:Cir_N domain-containing protein n=1 Tax=Heterorhabditis bacteriophora TaxID=37862 RepID=A0A1I7WFU6_HETBA
MNILPKKNWHVRTKENIERVRRDEAKAAEEEQRRLDRAILAENERRLELLRKKADERIDKTFGTCFEDSQRNPDVSISSETGHVNLFKDLEREERKNLGVENKEYEEEKQKMKQEWESKMGIQKYLGEGSSEYEKKQAWYENIPIRKIEVKESKYTLSSKESDAIGNLKSKRRLEKSRKKEKAKRKRSRSSSCESYEYYRPLFDIMKISFVYIQDLERKKVDESETKTALKFM